MVIGGYLPDVSIEDHIGCVNRGSHRGIRYWHEVIVYLLIRFVEKIWRYRDKIDIL